MEINDPRIEAYFNFELSSEEAKAFLEEAKKFPEVWQEIQFKQWMIDGIQDEGKIELKEFISNRLAEEREESTGKFWYSAAAIAIALVVGFGIAWPYLNKPSVLSEQSSAIESAMDSSYALDHTPYPTKNQRDKESADTMNESMAVLSASEEGEEAKNSMELSPSEDGIPEDDAMMVAKTMHAEPSEYRKSEADVDFKSNRGYSDVLSTNIHSTDLDLKAGAAAVGEELLPITEFQVKPIQARGEIKTKELITAATLKKSKTAPSSENHTPPSTNKSKPLPTTTMFDTVTNVKSGEIGRAKLKSPTSSEDKFTLVLSRSSSGKPSGFTNKTAVGSVNYYTIVLNNFGDLNALIYRLGNNYYLEAGTQFYQVNMQSGSTWQPKQVTDKSILQQLNP